MPFNDVRVAAGCEEVVEENDEDLMEETGKTSE